MAIDCAAAERVGLIKKKEKTERKFKGKAYRDPLRSRLTSGGLMIRPNSELS